MASPFSKGATPANRVKRNFFDKSHQVNTTMNYGRLQPFLVNEVLPGDTCKIDLAFGIRALPTAFPVQTKVRVDSHLFYVRSRTLWKDFQDWFCNHDSSLVMPYLSSDTLVSDLKTRSLYDFMGLPTTVQSFSTPSLSFKFENFYSSNLTPSQSSAKVAFSPFFIGQPKSTFDQSLGGLGLYLREGDTSTPYFVNISNKKAIMLRLLAGTSDIIKGGSTFDFSFKLNTAGDSFSFLNNPNLCVGIFYATSNGLYLSSTTRGSSLFGFVPGKQPSYDPATNTVRFSMNCYEDVSLQRSADDNSVLPLVMVAFLPYALESDSVVSSIVVSDQAQLPVTDAVVSEGDFINGSYSVSESSSVSESYIRSLPRINALPFRAYEAIYNSFYRDNRNNPLLDSNGQPIYNKYVLNVDGGEDITRFHMYNRNWEQDYYTTATTSPMAGTAPLVGITSTGVASFADDDGTIHTVKLETAADGDTVTGASYTDNLPNSVARSLVNMSTSGFSISDFRGVNALTRFLEINLRRGLRYKDQIKSHFNSNPTYEELDMPEFLGGFTQFFDSSQVNATAETEGNPLGSYAGQMSAVGGSRHTIRKTFDEPGYLIGIVSIVPVPAYSQNLPKLYLKHDLLDYYFPEFGHLGFQPILRSEVAPFQAISAGVDPSGTFGYQRAWYDYMMDLDEVHGNFRDSLSDFVIYRRYGSVPSISTDFVTVQPNQINNVFTVDPVQNDIDPFLGQIHIKSHWKRPIPRYVQPSLEANL